MHRVTKRKSKKVAVQWRNTKRPTRKHASCSVDWQTANRTTESLDVLKLLRRKKEKERSLLVLVLLQRHHPPLTHLRSAAATETARDPSGRVRVEGEHHCLDVEEGICVEEVVVEEAGVVVRSQVRLSCHRPQRISFLPLIRTSRHFSLPVSKTIFLSTLYEPFLPSMARSGHWSARTVLTAHSSTILPVPVQRKPPKAARARLSSTAVRCGFDGVNPSRWTTWTARSV